jgi:hypothetical protein
MPSGNNHIKTYTAADIQTYLDGQMSTLEMHAFEKAALEDPFLADAIEGYKESGVSTKEAQGDLWNALEKRVTKNGNSSRIPAGLKVAAVMAVISIGALTLVLKPRKSTEAIVEARSKPVVPADTNSSLQAVDSSVVAFQATPLKQRQPKVRRDETGIAKADELLGDRTIQPAAPEESVVEREETEQLKPVSAAKKAASRSMDMASNSMDLMKGIVLDDDKKPIAGAYVSFGNQGVVTDSTGLFFIKPADSVLVVQVQSAGYFTNSTSLKKNSGIDTIILEPSSLALEEVAVVGYGVKKSNGIFSRNRSGTSPSVSPSIPWEKYNAYITEKLDSAAFEVEAGEEIVISFLVDRNGQLSKFRVEQSALTQEVNDFLIEMIRTGPGWTLKGAKPRRATVRIIPGKTE